MKSGRCDAYLDLAARAEPDAVPDLLREAELDLPMAALHERLGARGRLAAAWPPYEPNRAVRHLDAALAEVDRELRSADADHKALANGIAAAAVALPPEFSGVARDLLDRLEPLTVNGLVDDAFVRAVRLRLEWGEHDRAQAIITRILDWNGTVWTTSKIAKVLERHDPARALRLMKTAYAKYGPAKPTDGRLERFSGDGNRHTMAGYLADRDTDRAAEPARGIITLTWSDPGHDRYTALAGIAHAQLDRGEDERAATLLEEALRQAETPPPLVDENWAAPFRRVEEQGPPATRATRDHLTDIAYFYNTDQGWQRRRRDRFFQDTTDVIRAVLPGPAAIGNPYSWARTLRVLAEAIAPHDHDRALALVRSLAPVTETAAGLAALVADAGRRNDRPGEDRRWRELEAALTRIEPYRWVGESQDDHAWAYLRPDHRARFDVATRILPTTPTAGTLWSRRPGRPTSSTPTRSPSVAGRPASTPGRSTRGARHARCSRGCIGSCCRARCTKATTR
jgi:hypothetical protein